jgi:hypothetical protein
LIFCYLRFYTYCHGGEITAVDVTGGWGVLVTDNNVLVWNIQEDPDRDALMLVPVQRTGSGLWLSMNWRLYDLASGTNMLDMETAEELGSYWLDQSITGAHV